MYQNFEKGDGLTQKPLDFYKKQGMKSASQHYHRVEFTLT
jgi:hypothetical protein